MSEQRKVLLWKPQAAEMKDLKPGDVFSFENDPTRFYCSYTQAEPAPEAGEGVYSVRADEYVLVRDPEQQQQQQEDSPPPTEELPAEQEEQQEELPDEVSTGMEEEAGPDDEIVQ